jgi:hypothetical protein
MPHVSFHSAGDFLNLTPRRDTLAIRMFNPGATLADGTHGWGQTEYFYFWDIHGAALSTCERMAIAADHRFPWLCDRLLKAAQSRSSWPVRPPLRRDAKIIGALLKQAWGSGMNVVVHCEFGQSRSGAVALAASEIGFYLAEAPSRPNPLLLSMLRLQARHV